MASYDDWNAAIADAFTKGVPRGAPVYLATDDEELAIIGATSFGGEPAQRDGWTHDFCLALRARVVAEGAVQLSRLRHQGSDSEPPASVAFLAAMVLAASRMGETEETSELNYFTHLRDILGAETKRTGSNRPPGLDVGEEESLWLAWNDWLRRRGLLPTAVRGDSGPYRYINYPLSQVLLRKADRQHLADVFERHKSSIPAFCDPQTLAATIEKDRWPTAHLRELMKRDGLRRAAAQDAVFEAYELWKASPGSTETAVNGRPRPLIAGLFRVEDPITGVVSYRLLPRMRRGRDTAARPTIVQDGSQHRLRPMREGWYEPAGAISERTLETGARYPLDGLPGIDAVELPKRSFWMLVPEPDDPESGRFASWGPPRLGEPFILLASESLRRDLQLLKDEGLVEWEGEPRPTLPGWEEYHDFLAVSEAWDGVHTEDPQLCQQLRPRGSLSISVFGGLRSPSGAWLVGHGPQVVVRGFGGSGQVTLEESPREEKGSYLRLAFRMNQPVEGLDWDRPGTFELTAETGGERSEARLVRIVSWDQLAVRRPQFPLAQVFGETTIRGATVSLGGIKE